MIKVVFIILLLAMVAHLIKPFGILGLNKRGDFWKIAIFAFGFSALAFFIGNF